MKEAVSPAWDPQTLWEIHETIQCCSELDRPRIRTFPGEDGLNSHSAQGAVLPAAFNPPTRAHTAFARWAMSSAGFHRVLALLDVQHADKSREDAVLEDRALMMRIAFGLDSRVILGVSSHGRFVDKLKALESRCSETGRWTFLVGLDNFARILDPRFYEEPDIELADLFKRASFVIWTRPKVSRMVQAQLRRWILRGARLTLMAAPEEARGVSSTLVRTEKAKGRPVSDWVDTGVEAFIEETGLYRDSPPHPPLYEARKRLLAHLFTTGRQAYEKVDMRLKVLEISRAIQENSRR